MFGGSASDYITSNKSLRNESIESEQKADYY